MTTHELQQLVRRIGAPHNFAPLVEVRSALEPMPRAEQDALIRQARIEWLITVAGIEGRFGISPAERAAGIREGDTLLGYLSCR